MSVFPGLLYRDLVQMDVRDVESWYNEACIQWANERMRAINNYRIALAHDKGDKIYKREMASLESMIKDVQWKER